MSNYSPWTPEEHGFPAKELIDEFVAGVLAQGDPELKETLIGEYPELIRVARANFKLKREIKNGKVTISENVEQKLDDLIGREWMYNGRNIQVRGYSIKKGEVRVKTTGHPIVFPESKAGEELKNFLETEAGSVITKKGAKKSNMAVKVFENDSEQMSSLEEIIMDNINKVKEDPKYVPQAKVITNNVNTMINLNKQKIEMIKEIRKHG